MIQLRPPSIAKPWDEFVSVDPVFVQMPQPPPEPTDEDAAAFKKALEEYSAKLKAARETGDWKPMLMSGESLDNATRFGLLQVDANIWRALIDRSVLSVDSRLRIGGSVLRALLVRLALKSISGCDMKIERVHDDEYDCVMAKPEIIDLLDKQNPAIVGELGNRIVERLRGVSPL